MRRREVPGKGKPIGEPGEFDLEQMEKETEEMLKTFYLNKKNAEFSRTKGGFLSLKLEEQFYPRVNVVRMFPFREMERYLSIRTADERSKEIGVVKDIWDVDSETRNMLREQLKLRYFTPVITKVISIKSEFGYSYWEVVTNQGACRFTVRMGGNAILHLSETRILIMDIDENRFEISDVEKLTASERRKLDLFL